jgi:hypothetical protein
MGLGRGRTYGPMGPVAFALDLHLQERDCTPGGIDPSLAGRIGSNMQITIILLYKNNINISLSILYQVAIHSATDSSL